MLSIDEILAQGLTRSQSTRYEDTGFIKPLTALIDALNTEADLNTAGIAFHQSRLQGLLQNRKALEDWTREHPEIAEETLVAPIVIVGLPRTGTTLLHRTIATDTSLMAPLWYEVRQPAPIDMNFVSDDGRIAIAKAEVDAMLAAMPGLAAIHPIDAVAPDEEIMLLEHSFISTVPECYASIPKYGEALYAQDPSASYDYLYKMLQFLQWQKRQKGELGQRWLLKTPHHLHYPQQLFQTFPDAVVIQTHRHPSEVMPSYASMMCELAAPFANNLNKQTLAAHWVKKWQQGLTATQHYRDLHPDAPYFDLQFQDSIHEPEAVLSQLYAFANLELTDQTLQEMQRWREFNQREARPEHHYTAEEFGLEEGKLNLQFVDYIARHVSG